MIVLQIYLAHSRTVDYINDLYSPIKNSQKLREYTFYLPHDNNRENYNDYNFYKQFNLILAEVSEPSTGLGIELGWANMLQIPIVCIYKKGTKITASLSAVTNEYIEYSSSEELVNKLYEYIQYYNK